MSKKVLYEFAYSNLENREVHISEIASSKNGEKCRCVCPYCGAPMLAKIGEIRQKHFSHKYYGEYCTPKHANETALHKLAKRTFEKYSYIELPSFYINGDSDPNCNKNDEKQLEKYKCFDGYLFYYDNVNVEENIGNIIPDIILSSNMGSLFVEIAVTHKVDNIKKEKIKEKNISCIEINLKEFYNCTDFNLEKFEKELILNTRLKRWIFNKKEGEFLSGLITRNKNLQKEFLIKNQEKIFIKREKFLALSGEFKYGDNVGLITCDSEEEIRKNISGTKQVRDGAGNRMVMCIKCGKIDRASNFQYYGTPSVNEGLCSKCAKEERQKRK